MSLIFRKNTLYLFLLFAVVMSYLIPAWTAPMCEDTGYYGFLSKAIANGFILHVDFHAITDGLILYIVAGLFKLFGASLTTYRVFYDCGFLCLIFTCYFCVRRFCGDLTAFFTSFLIILFSTLPYLSLDLGRNPLIFVALFLMLGLYFYVSIGRYSLLFSGFCFGIAALIREPILFVIIYCLIYSLAKNRHALLQKNVVWQFVVGVCIAFLLKAILLTYYQAWHGFFYDMLHLASTSRQMNRVYNFLIIKRVVGNLFVLYDGYQNYYEPIIVIMIIGYCIKTENDFINHIKFMMLPALLIEAVVINKSQFYSVQLILMFGSMLSIATLGQCYHFYKKALAKPETKLIYNIIAILAITHCLPFVVNIHADYSRFLHAARQMKNQHLNQNFWQLRSLNIINEIPHKIIATHSEYPLLFASKVTYKPTYPYTLDMSAPSNMHLPAMAKDQIDFLRAEKADILILKSTIDTLDSYRADYLTHYILIAHFAASDPLSLMMTYFDNIYLSKRFFMMHYRSIKTISLNDNREQLLNKTFNYEQHARIITLNVSPLTCLSHFILKSGVAKSSLKNTRSKQQIALFVATNATYQLDQVTPCDHSSKAKLILTEYAYEN